MALTINKLRTKADTLHARGIEAQAEAERARADYARLNREYRQRCEAKGISAVVADARFGGLAVAADCIDSEQMYGRWAVDRFAASAANYAKVEQLMTQLSAFLRQRRDARPSPTPRQRSGS
jgi:hypothetical protein